MPIFTQGMTRNKLLLLHLIDAAPYALTERQMYTVLFETDTMSYFDYCEASAQLSEDGYVTTEDAPGGIAYRMTDRGRETLGLFRESVPVSLRESVSMYEEENRDRLRSTAQNLTKMRPMPDGGYRVQLTAADGDRVLLSLELSAATREIALRMRENWEAACPALYRTVLDTLLKP